MCQLCHAHLSFFSLYSSCSSFCHRPSMIGSGTAPQPICRRVAGQSCKRASATQHGTAATAVTALGTVGEGCLPSAIALAFASILDRRSAVSTLISSHTRLSAARGCGPMATRARSKLTACTVTQSSLGSWRKQTHKFLLLLLTLSRWGNLAQQIWVNHGAQMVHSLLVQRPGWRPSRLDKKQT